MRVATQIVTLTGVLIALLVVVLGLHVWSVQRLAEVTASLPDMAFRVGAANLELDRRLAVLIEFSQKAELSGGEYAAVLEPLRNGVEQRMAALAALSLSPAERGVVEQLQDEWRSYRALPAPSVAEPPPAEDETGVPSAAEHEASPQVVAVPPPHLGLLAAMRTRLRELAATSEAHLAARQRDVAATAARTRRVAWRIAAVVMLAALPVLWWTIRSIHRPLRRLTAGTRDVAAGRFTLQLDATGGDELAEVAESFNHMVRQLRELDELKSDFLSHVSHELATPLVAMRETNELVLEGLAGPLTAEQQRMLELNRDGALRLSAMIRRILDLSRLEAGAMEYDFETLEVGSLLRTAVDEFAAAAQERDIELQLVMPAEVVRVRCDRDRLLQVWENLLSNAIKFGPAGSRVKVTLTVPDAAPARSVERRKAGSRAVVTVSDEGPGVPAEQRQRIFDKFHRGSRQGSHGFGLGLAISREIVTAHGGRIWAEDAVPRGTVFGVELAALRAATAAPLEAAGGSRA
jgi:two-component system, NtrC family, sensor histidine kinase GlrK